jgi:hypothetical protein
MALRPSSSRHTLALLGAALVAWGAWNPVLWHPVLRDINLFKLDAPAAWTLCAAAALAMTFVWWRRRGLAWVAFFIAVASVALLCHDLLARVEDVKSAGFPAELVDRIVMGFVIKPGAVGVGAGLVILAVSLGMTRRAHSA